MFYYTFEVNKHRNKICFFCSSIIEGEWFSFVSIYNIHIMIWYFGRNSFSAMHLLNVMNCKLF